MRTDHFGRVLIGVLAGLLITNASAFGKGGVDGGGGSIDRVLWRAKLIDKKSRTYRAFNRYSENKMRNQFLKSADAFYSKLARRIFDGPAEGVSFRDPYSGQTAIVDRQTLSQLADLISRFKAEPKRRIRVLHQAPISAVDQAEIYALNFPERGEVAVSLDLASYAHSRYLYDGAVGLSLVGHELLSLLGVEGPTNYAVSTSDFRETFGMRDLTCHGFRYESNVRTGAQEQVAVQAQFEFREYEMNVVLSDNYVAHADFGSATLKLNYDGYIEPTKFLPSMHSPNDYYLNWFHLWTATNQVTGRQLGVHFIMKDWRDADNRAKVEVLFQFDVERSVREDTLKVPVRYVLNCVKAPL